MHADENNVQEAMRSNVGASGDGRDADEPMMWTEPQTMAQ
jgi:hypothetical protein